jgi:hypothetical protein
VRRLFLALAAIALVVLSGSTVVWWRTSQTDAAIETTWQKMLGGESFRERFPATDSNETLLDLQRLAAAIGIEMAAPGAAENPQPTPEATRRFGAIEKDLYEFLDPNVDSEDGAFPAPPMRLSRFGVRARTRIEAIATLLTTRPPPTWESDLYDGLEGAGPHLGGVLNLQKLLLFEAIERLRSGHLHECHHLLEAAWNFEEAIRANPTLVAQLVSQTNLKPLLAVLRSVPSAPAVWHDRLAGLDLRRGIYVALHTEAFVVYNSAGLEKPLLADDPPRWTDPIVRWGARDYARRFVPMIEELAQRDVRTFDPVAFDREMVGRLPRWQIVARLMLQNFWTTWPSAARVELAGELTARILAERDRQAAGGPPRNGDREPSRVEGLHWVYEATPAGTTIRLDGEMRYRPKTALPLRFTIR